MEEIDIDDTISMKDEKMDDKLELFTTAHKRQGVKYGNFTYRLSAQVRKKKKSKTVNWRCTYKYCTACIVTDEDYTKVIKTCRDHNHEPGCRRRQNKKNGQLSEISSGSIRQRGSQKLQLNLINTFDRRKKENSYNRSKRVSTLQIGNLQATLDERKGSFNYLSANKSPSDDADDASPSHSEQERISDDDGVRCFTEVSELQDRIISLQNKVDVLETKNRQQNDEIYDLRLQLTDVQNEVTLKVSLFEEQMLNSRQAMEEKDKDITFLHGRLQNGGMEPILKAEILE